MLHPDFDPIAFSIGPFAVHWYGIMYLLAFALAWALGQYRARKPQSGWSSEEVNDIVFYSALGAVIGGRIGYMLFYQFDALWSVPLSLLRVWEGGMSFHGGLLGAVLAMLLFARKTKKTFLNVLDFLAPLVPLGLGFGRMGNFINGELWGRVTMLPWGMVFPYAGPLPRHPTPIYEAFGEGIILFLVVWIYSSKPRPTGSVAGLFLISYGLIRFIIEFFREPDVQLGFIAFDWLTMGQLLSIPMIVIGMILLFVSAKHARQGHLS